MGPQGLVGSHWGAVSGSRQRPHSQGLLGDHTDAGPQRPSVRSPGECLVWTGRSSSVTVTRLWGALGCLGALSLCYSWLGFLSAGFVREDAPPAVSGEGWGAGSAGCGPAAAPTDDSPVSLPPASAPVERPRGRRAVQPAPCLPSRRQGGDALAWGGRVWPVGTASPTPSARLPAWRAHLSRQRWPSGLLWSLPQSF